MDIESLSFPTPHTTGTVGTIPTQFGAVSTGSFTSHNPHIPHQTFISEQYACNIATNTQVPNQTNPTLPPVDPNYNQSQQNIESGDCKAQFTHGNSQPKTYIVLDGNG